jgi:hypothetical protein
MNWGTSLFIIAMFILFVWSLSQTRFKNKMLCRFRRPNHQLIEKWVPLEVKYVIFDAGKGQIGQYTVDPRCIQHMWYDRGINKLFPTLIPTMDFRYDTPYPLNPESFEVTWYTPEVVRAAWQEHNAQEFAKGAASQATGKKKEKFGMGMFLAICAVVLVIMVGFLWYRQSVATAKDLANLHNTLNTINAAGNTGIGVSK